MPAKMLTVYIYMLASLHLNILHNQNTVIVILFCCTCWHLLGNNILTTINSVSPKYISCQGWDSSAFTRISVEQKLKSVVDDDHFRRRQIDEKQNKKNPKQSESVIGLDPHSVAFSSYSRMCTRALHCCFGFQKWPRERKKFR